MPAAPRTSHTLGTPLLVVALAVTCTIRDADAPPLAITHVTVIDVERGTRRPDQTVLIVDGRIAADGDAATTRLPDGARIVDGRGKFLIPGLWDMHVHTAGPDADAMLPIYVAYGVTGVRDMGADFTQLSAWRARIRAGERVGPRIVMAGPILDGPLGFPTPAAHRRWRIELADTAQARRVVDSLAALGVDFIKVHERLSAAVYAAIVRTAGRHRLPIAGHISGNVGPVGTVAAGQRSIEHLVNVPIPCTAAEAAALRPRTPLERLFGQCDTTDQSALVRRFAVPGVWHTPTLVVQRLVALGRDSAAGDPGTRHVPPGVRAMLRGVGPFELPPQPDSVVRRLDRLLEKRIRQTGDLYRAGVPILAGTDAPGVAPGWSLHAELELLVRAGLSPAAALRAATLEPARWLRATDSLGTIAAGKVADLVLLDADPLEDIRHTRRINTVIAAGRVVERAERERILSGVSP